jgi:hypothetical protein
MLKMIDPASCGHRALASMDAAAPIAQTLFREDNPDADCDRRRIHSAE